MDFLKEQAKEFLLAEFYSPLKFGRRSGELAQLVRALP